MLKKQTNDEAIQQWKKYLKDKEPMVIRSTPKSWGIMGPVYVAPVSARSFSMGDFSDQAAALVFCKQNGLPVGQPHAQV